MYFSYFFEKGDFDHPEKSKSITDGMAVSMQFKENTHTVYRRSSGSKELTILAKIVIIKRMLVIHF
jgi:hypothetical protein